VREDREKAMMLLRAGASPNYIPERPSYYDNWYSPVFLVLSVSDIPEAAALELFEEMRRLNVDLVDRRDSGCISMLPCSRERLLVYANAGGSFDTPRSSASSIVHYAHIMKYGWQTRQDQLMDHDRLRSMMMLCMRLGAPVRNTPYVNYYKAVAESPFCEYALQDPYPEDDEELVAAVRSSAVARRTATTLALLRAYVDTCPLQAIPNELMFIILRFVVQVDYRKKALMYQLVNLTQSQ